MSDYLVFDDIDTRNLSNIYVFPNKVDDTPKRVYEVKNIAGRNGGLYVDQYCFEDVEHTYSIAALTKEDGVNFINKLASKIGYFRLSDSFNPDEYYMAVFTSGAEVIMPSSRNKSVFEITFTRKPQRFLTSGETAQTITSGSTITNPTLFDASPQIQAWGYGDISLGGQKISVANVLYGYVILAESVIFNQAPSSVSIPLEMGIMNTGNSFEADGVTIVKGYEPSTGYRVSFLNIGAGTNCSAISTTDNIQILVAVPSFAKGTSSSSSYSITATVRVTKKGTGTYSDTSVTFSGTVSYNGNSTITVTQSASPSSVTNVSQINTTIRVPDVVGNSTKSALGSPLYIDLDIGEAYNEDSGTPVSVNNAVIIPSHLPTLPSGATTITFDNTFTQVKIVPRWWQV